MKVWTLLRCVFEIATGSAGLAHAFTGFHSLYAVALAFLNFDEDQRIALIVFAALVIGGIVEIIRGLIRPSSSNE